MAGLAIVTLALAYQVRSRVFIDLGSNTDDFFVRRFYEPESAGTDSYRWSQEQSWVELEGQQLSSPWNLRIRLNGYRPDRFANIVLHVDQTQLDEFEAIGEWDIFDKPANIASDLWTGNTTLFISSDAFIPQEYDPNNPDTRQLGIGIDWIEWTPMRSGAYLGNDEVWLDFGQLPVLPPFAVVLSWAAGIGLLYASARFIGLGARSMAIVFPALIVLLAFGFAFRRAYVATFTTEFLNLALVLTFLTLVYLLLVPRFGSYLQLALDRRNLAGLGAIVLLSIGLKWGGAWYPQFQSSDLTFHGHRLEFVARGQLFFTSELPDAARRVVPYPPALYTVLAPMAPWAPDYQGLLILANVMFDAAAIVAFYFAARLLKFPDGDLHVTTPNTPFALFATFLFAFNPVSFWIYSWGNHTNIFGQMAATLLFCTLLTQPWARPRNLFLALFFLVLASTAHLGVFLSLLAFFPLAAVLRLLSTDGTAKREGIALLSLLITGIVLAWLLYYGEFTEPLFAQAYKFLNDFGAGRAGTSGDTLKRVSDVARFTWDQLGWVLLVGGIAGIPLAWRTFAARARAVWLAWLIVGVLFGLVTIGSTFSTRYTLWAAPALALCGGLVLAWLFERTSLTRLAGYALCVFAFTQTLWLWIDRILNAYQ